MYILCYAVLSRSIVTLCNPMGCSLPGSSVHGDKARILEWVAMLSSRGSSQLRDQTQVSCIADRFFTSWGTREVLGYTQKKNIIQKDTGTPILFQHYLQQPRQGSNRNVHQQSNRFRCAIYIYNGILLSHKKNEIMSFAATWMNIEMIILSEVSLRKINIIWYHSCVESNF